MGTLDISWLSLLVGLCLLIIPIWFLLKYRTGLVGSVFLSTTRMVVQLSFIGFYLKYLFLWNNFWINLLWMFIMALAASETAVTRVKLKNSILWLPTLIGFLTGAILVGSYFLLLVLGPNELRNARYFIPIFGILMGNELSSNVIGLNAYYSSLQREQQQYYYLLGNGATLSEARRPFVREALIQSFTPCIANMAVMGLVALPGTMIGQILGGSSPDVAIKYQMMIIVITFTASMVSMMITIHLASKHTFDAFGRIKDLHVNANKSWIKSRTSSLKAGSL